MRLLLADDHPIVLDGLSALLAAAGFEIVARCRRGDTVSAEIADTSPDIAILDIQMPGMTGIDILRDLRTRRVSSPKVIILTASLDKRQVLEAVELEADGLMLKETAAERIVQCVEEVAAGRQWIDNDALMRIMGELTQKEERTRGMRELTARESEVARLAARGVRNRDIALALGLADSTVKMHLGNIFDKLEVGSRAELAAFARDFGLADPLP